MRRPCLSTSSHSVYVSASSRSHLAAVWDRLSSFGGGLPFCSSWSTPDLRVDGAPPGRIGSAWRPGLCRTSWFHLRRWASVFSCERRRPHIATPSDSSRPRPWRNRRTRAGCGREDRVHYRRLLSAVESMCSARRTRSAWSAAPRNRRQNCSLHQSQELYEHHWQLIIIKNNNNNSNNSNNNNTNDDNNKNNNKTITITVTIRITMT